MNLKEYLGKLDVKLDTVIEVVQQVRVENAVQTVDISNIKKDLYEHKEGVQQNRARIQRLETQSAFFPQLAKVIAFATVTVTLIIGVGRMFGWP